ncbi:MAG: hypothetical protein ACR2K3_01380 [Nocardioides sp.]
MSEETPDRQDAEALLETRRELGSAYDAELVASFADRVERAISTRGSEESEIGREDVKLRAQLARQQLTLGIVSVGCGIPITAISAALAQLPGLGVAWVGIVGINVAHALQGRRSRH